jgi:hypothetical protein
VRVNFPFNSTVPPIRDQILRVFSRLSGEASPPPISAKGLEVGPISSANYPKHDAIVASGTSRPQLVGGRQHVLRDRCGDWDALGWLALGARVSPRSLIGFQHRVGRGRRDRARSALAYTPGMAPGPKPAPFPGVFRQRRCHRDSEEGAVPYEGVQRRVKADLPVVGWGWDFTQNRTCPKSRQRIGRAISRRRDLLLKGLPYGVGEGWVGSPFPPAVEVTVFMIASSTPATVSPSHDVGASLLRPDCNARDRLLRWRGVNTPPQSTIADPWIRGLEAAALAASFSDPASYGSGIKKFHTFCDIFSIPEADRLPAPFEVLHSFILWASADADIAALSPSSPPPTAPVAESTVRHYLAAIRAWHLVQGWNPPLGDSERDRINISLRGIAKLQAARHQKPIRPPVTTAMLHLLTLGARGGVLTQYITNTLQGNGQRT